jgi:hypothetical protein
MHFVDRGGPFAHPNEWDYSKQSSQFHNALGQFALYPWKLSRNIMSLEWRFEVEEIVNGMMHRVHISHT